MENKEISPLMTGKLHKHTSAAFPSIVSPGKWPVRAEQPLYYRTESSLKRMSGTELWWLRFGELANTLSHERELLPQGKSAGSWHLAALVVWTEWKLSEEKQDSGKCVSHHGNQTASQTWQPFPVGSAVMLTNVIFDDVSLNAPTLGDLYHLVKQCITFK